MSLFHKITREGRSFQRHTLYLFARYFEIPLLKASYQLLRGRWRWLGRIPAVRWLLSVCIARPFALYGDRARPIPYDQVIHHVETVEGEIAVGPCRCRICHYACEHPVETDIVVRTGAEAWLKAFPRDYRIIEKGEAKRILTECHAMGMFHMLFFHYPTAGCSEYVICNCCVCGCVPHILNRDLGQKYFPLFRGAWIAVTNSEACRGDGACVDICPFGVRSLAGGKAVTGDCFGCGLCASICPENAITMEPAKGSHHAPGRIGEGKPRVG
jgi:ferredoxin